MIQITVRCQDKYEAQKLASIIYLKEEGQTFLDSVVGVYDTEVVVSLKDKSVHSVMMADAANADVFVDFVQSITDGAGRMLGTDTDGPQVKLVKSD